MQQSFRPVKSYERRRHRLILAAFAAMLGLTTLLSFGTSHASTSAAAMTSGVRGLCLDDYRDITTKGAAVDIWDCNHTSAQNWTVTDTTIRHEDDQCLTVTNNNKVNLEPCAETANQVWLRDNSGYQNPNTQECLNAPSTNIGARLTVASCANLASSNETWKPPADTNPACTGTERQVVACYAIKEWTTWQAGTSNHNTLLNTYTDGAPAEEWCADFVSYVYKEAGYPFTQGNTNGWDENIADNVQYMGFTLHNAGSYVPQAGDVAFFDYTGGHVEIVVSGGQTPTFVYGNSDTIDPTTGNGEMEANTITSKGPLGQVIYYLSPIQD
jgi:hypothetical protein